MFVYTTEKKDSDRRGPSAVHPVPGQIEAEIIEWFTEDQDFPPAYTVKKLVLSISQNGWCLSA